MNQEQANRRRFLHGVMLAVLAWGSLLSLGAFLFGTGPDGLASFSPSITRGLIAFSCVAIFVGGWALLVRQQRTL